MQIGEQEYPFEDIKTTLNSSADDLQGKDAAISASQLFGRTDGKVKPIIIDPMSQALVEIDFGHHEIHEGDHYYVKNFVDLTGGQVLDFLIITPDTTKYSHMVVAFSFEAEANAIIYEGATTSANGSAVSVFNRERNSSNTNTLLLYTGPTVTGTGTQIAAYKAGSGKSAGVESRASAELVLKRNTKYIVRVTNDTVTNNWCDYLADWYEHTNLN